MLENAHKRDMKKVQPTTFFMFPLNDTNKMHNNVNTSKSIPIALSIYEVASKGTSTYWPIIQCIMAKFVKDMNTKI